MTTQHRTLLFALFFAACSYAVMPSVEAGTAAPPSADLAVTKAADSDQTAAGANVTYTIHVTNSGPDNSTVATLKDPIPSQTTFVSVTPDPDWTCNDPTASGQNNTLVCTRNSVPIGADDVFTLVVKIDPNAAPGSIITNSVNVSTPPYNDPNLGLIDTDPNPDNNTAFANTTVPGGAARADLSVSKMANTDHAVPDSDVTFTIQVASAGDSTNATLTDTLPSDMTFVSFSQNSGPTWTCSTPSPGNGGTVSCTISLVPSGSSSTFVITGHIPPSTRSGITYDNIATVSSDDDVNSENNSSDATVTVVAAAPTLTTQASGSVMLGGSISDTATLSGSQSATGTIAFFAYGPDNSTCGGDPAFTSFVDVHGDGQYTSDPFTPTAAGKYRFIASYGGDFNNKDVTTACNDANESVVVIAPTPTPTATATATPTATATATPTATPAKALNLSTRANVQTGDRVVIGGFIITGNNPKAVVVRGLGPSLAKFGITDFLPDPVLELRDNGGSLIASNDNWKDTQRSQIEGTVYQPSDDRESVIVATLPPGAYTAVLSGKNQTSGIGTFEVYDNNQAVDSLLANMSTRGFVQTGTKVMIGGFVLGGNNANGFTRVAIRGLGPSLSRFGLSSLLADPVLGLYNANGALFASNDDWQNDPVSAAQLTANGLALPDRKESGIFISLPPGQFTAIISGVNDTSGLGLVEIYNLR